MAEIYSSGLLGAGQFRSYDITPHQAIIFGRRGQNHTITAAQAHKYIYSELSGSNVSEGREFLDLESAPASSVLLLLPEIQTELDAHGAMIINASSQWQCTDDTNRRFMKIAIMDWNTKQELYDFGINTGSPYGNRLNLAQTTIVTPVAFDTTPDNRIIPVLQFYGEQGDQILNWGITCIYQ